MTIKATHPMVVQVQPLSSVVFVLPVGFLLLWSKMETLRRYLKQYMISNSIIFKDNSKSNYIQNVPLRVYCSVASGKIYWFRFLDCKF